ncbi:MAG: CHAD domain-containing protein [Myxococcales bacterium]|nr:CHAD domain-containing protein [Myxococcales bacterium]
MKFRVDLASNPADEARRILLQQADTALSGLRQGPSEGAVHEARKSCKRARAAVALVAGGLPPAQAKTLDRAFRDAARPIGAVRDADVMRKTLASLGSSEEAPEVERQGPCAAAVAALEAARQQVEAADLSAVTHTTLLEGLVSSWRSARREWDDANDDGHPEAFHEWRKAVKQLLYHVQLLTELDEPVMGALDTQLDVLQEALGDHHDLYVLASTAPEADGDALKARALQLEDRALALGSWVLSSPPRNLRRWVRTVRTSG